MLDCEGKDIQIGDEVIAWGSLYRVGKFLFKGRVTKITKMKIMVNSQHTVEGYYANINTLYYPREVFKL